MHRRRVAAAWGTWLVVGGALTGTLGYALYHQSDACRRRIEADLREFFGLPLKVGGLAPHSFSARELLDLQVWLPEKGDLVFRCPRIVWDEAGIPGSAETAIDIYQPTWLLGSQTWGHGDYVRVLQAGLRHNFQAVNVGLIRLHQARLEWLGPDCRMDAEGVEGKLVFDAQGRGQADLTCHRFNGYDTAAPIHISARVDPEAEDLLPEVALVVPELPVSRLGLDPMLRSQVTQGEFSGTITLRQSAEGDRITLVGRAASIRLDEWTRRIPGGAIPGTLDLTIEEAVVENQRLQHLRFRGEAGGVVVDSLLSRFGWPQVGGTAQLRVFEAHVAANGVRRLNLAGHWDGGSLDSLCRKLLGRTGLDGRLRADINLLVIENNEIVSGDIELAAEPPNGRPGTIQQALLAEAFEKCFGLALPTGLLPERVEYVQMGVRILVDRKHVRVLSGHGPAGPAVITTRILGQDLPLGGQIDVRFPLSELLSKAEGPLQKLTRDLKGHLLPFSGLLAGSRPAGTQPSAR